MLKISGKIIYSVIGVVAGCALTVGLVTTNAARGSYLVESSEPSGSSETASVISSAGPSSEEPISSLAESSTPSSVAPASSKTEIEKQTDSGVSRIQKATDSGVSKIQEATSKAVQEVQKAVSETSSAPAHKITGDKSRLTGETSVTPWNVRLNDSMSFVDETNKIVVLGYFGHFGGDWEDAAQLKEYGFSVKNASGSELDYEPYDSCRLKVPYADLSGVSELYLCYNDQSIKITVS